MKSVFFTGATGGLGEVCVRALAARGWQVFAAGTNADKLAALAEMRGVIPVRCDVTDDASVQAARAQVLRHTDRLDAVVNFAGLTAFASLVEGDPVPAARRMVDVNLMGMVRVNAALFDLVHAARGRIVNCSSSAGWMTAQPFAGAYVASKRAVEGYSDSLRRELIFLGIPVVKLQPGPFRTGMMEDIHRGFEQTLADSPLYGHRLRRLRGILLAALGRPRDPQELVGKLLRALEDARPRRQYRAGSPRLLLALEVLPEGMIDALFRWAARWAGRG